MIFSFGALVCGARSNPQLFAARRHRRKPGHHHNGNNHRPTGH
jgi:hypothetical protein